MSDEPFFAEIDSFPFAFIRLQDDLDNTLDLMIEEAMVSETETSTLTIGSRHFVRQPIETTELSRNFLFRWIDYVAYFVTNESYARVDPHELYTGRMIRRYTRSRLLDFLASTQTATDNYPGLLIHLCLVSENHIVDVVSTQMPEVTRGQWPPKASAKPAKRSHRM